MSRVAVAAFGGVAMWLWLRNRACACPEAAATIFAGASAGLLTESPAGGWEPTVAPPVLGPAATPAPAGTALAGSVARTVTGSVVSAVICPDGYGPAAVIDGRVTCPNPYGDGARDGFCLPGSAVAVIDGKPRCRKF